MALWQSSKIVQWYISQHKSLAEWHVFVVFGWYLRSLFHKHLTVPALLFHKHLTVPALLTALTVITTLGEHSLG